MSDRIRWDIMGPGGITHAFAKLKTSEHAELQAVGSRSTDRAKAFAESSGFRKAYRSYEELAADPEGSQLDRRGGRSAR